MNKIYVELAGGLGNQVFQATAALALAKRGGHEPIAIVNSLSSENNHGNSINQLNWQVLKTLRLNRLVFKFVVLGFRLASMTKKKRIKIFDISFYCPSEVGYSIEEVEGKLVFLRGYFQSYKYFQQIPAEEMPTLKDESINFKRALAHARNKAAIGLHIRRGDFALSKNPHGLISMGFYVEALQRIKALTNDENKIWIFTDEVEVVRDAMISISKDIIFPAEKFELTTEEEFFLFSEIPRIVLGNSSFGLSAALIGELRRKNFLEKIVYPWPPFERMPSPLSMFPEHWTRIDSSFSSCHEVGWRIKI